MDKLIELVTRKRKLMSLPPLGEQDENFLSDVRHLAACTLICDQVKKKDEDVDAFINLEALDRDEATVVQRRYEGEFGIGPEPLTDLIDVEEKVLVEITFTSGNLKIAYERKRKRQRKSVVIVFAENLKEYYCNEHNYRKELITAVLGNLDDFQTVNNIPRALNQRGAIFKQAEIEHPEVFDQVIGFINFMNKPRDPKMVLEAVAKKDELKMSSKGARDIKPPKSKKILWMDPIFVEINSPFRSTDCAYGKEVEKILNRIEKFESNGKNREMLLENMIATRNYGIENSELVWKEKDVMKPFGEKVKKETATLDEIRSKGEKFEFSVRPSGLSYGTLSERWHEWEQFFLEKPKEEILEFLKEAEARCHAVGVSGGAIHRKTKMRIFRPLITSGVVWGLAFKSRSMAGSTQKDAYNNIIVFGKCESSDLPNYMWVDGMKYEWHLRTFKTRGDWITQQTSANRSRIWAADPSIDVNGLTPFHTPFTRQVIKTEKWRQVLIDQGFHLSNAWHHSPACEAGEAMVRKLVELVHAKNQKREYGCVGGLEGMCGELDDINKHLQTACDFRVMSHCEALMNLLK